MSKFSKFFLFTAIITASITSVYSQNYQRYQGNIPQGGRTNGSLYQQETGNRNYEQQENAFQDQSRGQNFVNPDYQNAPPQGRFFNPQNPGQYPQNPPPNQYVNANNPNMRPMRMIADQTDTSNPSAMDTDTQIVQKIRDRINNDPYLSDAAKDVQVTSADGFVGLRGTIHSNEEKSRIESIAKNTSGVKEVGNNLKVQ